MWTLFDPLVRPVQSETRHGRIIRQLAAMASGNNRKSVQTGGIDQPGMPPATRSGAREIGFGLDEVA